MKPLVLPLLVFLASCSSQPGSTPGSLPPTGFGMPQIINVSAYDPKERQRNGVGFSEHDVSALRANGASGLIARAGKGGNLDEKCASFLASADREGMLPGIYYRVQRHVDAVAQADQFVNRAMSLARGRAWNAPALLLCGDFDGDLPLTAILRFMDRVEARTGVVPVAYLENSTPLKQTLSGADAASKAKLRRMPYLLALYAHDSGAGPVYPAPGNPNGLLKQYDVWSSWTMWQYGGVDWQGGRSRPKVYNHDSYRFPLYFGNLDRPTERNVFNGSQAGLQSFWRQHGLPLR
jgi:GH25 family lysozyme M1 (1,4-beta-N-acetylmuramidase)